MGIDSDDRLLREGIGLNDNHEKKVQERLISKPFLPSFNGGDSDGPKFHYTSPQGLMGILKTRTLFFTDSQFLNDFREKVNINEELDGFWRRRSRYYNKAFLNLLKRIRVTQHEDNGFSYIDNNSDMLCRYFVLSLSLDGDNLSMWKYYAKTDNYNGYCLGIFDTAFIDEWIDRTTGTAVIADRVKYYPEEKQGIIFDIVERLYSIWKSYELSDSLNNKIIKEYTSWISVEALFFKDQCFEDERETRYVAVVPKCKLKRLHYEYKGTQYKMYDFRIVNGILVPYIKMPFNDWNQDECWAINSIRVGPSSNEDQKEAGLRQFMQSLDYEFLNCRIMKSNIPVRY